MQFEIIKNTPIVKLSIKTKDWKFVCTDFIIDTGFTWACALYLSKDDELFNNIDLIGEFKNTKIIMADNSEVPVVKTETLIIIDNKQYEIETILIEPDSPWWLPLIWIDFLMQINAELLFDFKKDRYSLDA